MRAQIDLCEIIWFCGINERKLHVSSFVWIADVVYNMWSEIYVEKAKRLFNFEQLKPFYTEIQAFRELVVLVVLLKISKYLSFLF